MKALYIGLLMKINKMFVFAFHHHVDFCFSALRCDVYKNQTFQKFSKKNFTNIHKNESVI